MMATANASGASRPLAERKKQEEELDVLAQVAAHLQLERATVERRYATPRARQLPPASCVWVGVVCLCVVCVCVLKAFSLLWQVERGFWPI